MPLTQDPRLAATRRNFPAAVALAEHHIDAGEAGGHHLIPTLTNLSEPAASQPNVWVVKVENEAGHTVGYIKEVLH